MSDVVEFSPYRWTRESADHFWRYHEQGYTPRLTIGPVAALLNEIVRLRAEVENLRAEVANARAATP